MRQDCEYPPTGGAAPRLTLPRLLRLAAIVAAALLLNLKGCNRADDALPDLAAGPGRPLAGGTDVTFFVAADTHFGHRGIDRLNSGQIAAMNDLPEALLPARIGGTVGRPRGLIIAGDLTENGRRAASGTSSSGNTA